MMIVQSFPKLVETKNCSKDLIGHMDETIGPLVLIFPKMIFKDKDGDKNENDKLMSLLVDGDKLLEKQKSIQNKIENLRNIELNALPTYDDGYINTKMKTFGDKVCNNFCGLSVPED